MSLAIIGGRVLLPDEGLVEADIRIEGGAIAAIDAGVGNAEEVIDAGGRLVLPGIVDIHGDAFERQIMPRPGVTFDLELALRESDRQMLANGITTAFHSVTYSWEPGLRGRENCIEIKDAIRRLNGGLGCDTRFHLRFETFNIDAADEVAGWLETGDIDVIAYNDHTPEIVHKLLKNPDKLARYTARTGLNERVYRDMAEGVYERKNEVPAVLERLAGVASQAGIAQLSHDDAAPETRMYFNDMGCSVAEFPVNEATARAARDLGNHVVMGAPNVVRGGSHNGAIGAADMIGKGLCTVLASDYYYPALMHAAFRLSRDGVADLAAGWNHVSRHAADAAGLNDRGSIEAGKRADIIIVEDRDPKHPAPVAAVVGGRLAYRGHLGSH